MRSCRRRKERITRRLASRSSPALAGGCAVPLGGSSMRVSLDDGTVGSREQPSREERPENDHTWQNHDAEPPGRILGMVVDPARAD